MELKKSKAFSIISVSYCETFLVMFLILKFVNHSHGVIFHRDEAIALFVNEKVVFANTVFACACSRLKITEIGGRRKEYPVNIIFFGKGVKIEFTK